MTWCYAQYWLGVLASYLDMAQALDHYTAVTMIRPLIGDSAKVWLPPVLAVSLLVACGRLPPPSMHP